MDQQEPKPDPADAALRRLEQRLDSASAATERLFAEAASAAASGAEAWSGAEASPGTGPGASGAPGAEAGGSGTDRAAGAGDPPPAGWQTRNGEQANNPGELDLLIGVLHGLRDLIPADLQRRLADALRELLLALRALIDWYLERSERRRGAAAEVQDIPIT